MEAPVAQAMRRLKSDPRIPYMLGQVPVHVDVVGMVQATNHYPVVPDTSTSGSVVFRRKHIQTTSCPLNSVLQLFLNWVLEVPFVD